MLAVQGRGIVGPGLPGVGGAVAAVVIAIIIVVRHTNKKSR